MDRVMVCWPTKWTEAAVKAGFATQVADGKWTFQSDAMRACLAEFAAAIRNEALEEAANVCETPTEYTVAGKLRYRSLDGLECSTAIRALKNA